MRKNMIIALCIGLLMSVAACSPRERLNENVSSSAALIYNIENSDASEDTDLSESYAVEIADEFLQKAYAMGYTDDQLEMLKSCGISEEIILSPETVSNTDAQSSDGHYMLCGVK